MFNPLVTIIIPVYNGDNYLRESINSAINQDYKNIEIIVVNDGSKDNGLTRSIALEYKDKIIYLEKENGGVSSALNFGLKAMQGEYFSWLSHDDYYYPNKISTQISYLSQLSDTNKTVLFSNCKQMNKNGKVIRTKKYRVNNNLSNKELAIKNIKKYTLNGCSMLIPRSALVEVRGFNERIRTISDAECWYKLIFMGYKFIHQKEVLVIGRQHKCQVGKTKKELFQKEGDELHIWILNRLSRNYTMTKKEYLQFYKGVTFRGYIRAMEQCSSMIHKKSHTVLTTVELIFVKSIYSSFRFLKTILRRMFRLIKVK